MNMTKKTLALAVVAASVMASAPAMAELSGNVGAVSNYIWRGVTQNNDGAAVQGGVDFTKDAFYAGVWTSSLAGSDYEADLYAGYKFEAAGLGYDIGVIDYVYPVETTGADDSFYEGYIGVSKDAFSAKVSYSPDVNLATGSKDESGIYVEAAYTMPVGDKSSLALHVGNYSGDGIDTLFGSSYSDASISLTKDAFTFGVTKTFGLDDEDYAAAGGTVTNPEGVRVFVGYKTSLGL